MEKFKVALVTMDHPIPDWVFKKFKDNDIEFVYKDCQDREDLKSVAADADVIFIPSSRKDLVCKENMDIFKKAKCVIKCGSGTDNIDSSACTENNIIVAHTPEDPTEPTSDHFISMLFSLVRQVTRQDRLVRSGIWDPLSAPPIGYLRGAQLGLIGFGRIGKAIAQKLSGFKMNLRIFDPYIKDDDVKIFNAKRVSLEELLKESQYIMTACPLIKETKDLIGEKELKMMRKDSLLVNVARAGIVNENALKKALKLGWIKGAAVDVLSEHPLGKDSEWLKLDNIIITPHMGGYNNEYPDMAFKTPVDVIIKLSKGIKPKWIVNKQCKPKVSLKEEV